MFLPESMSTGLPDVPYVPKAVLNVAVSALVVPLVAPGTTEPAQFDVSDQLPLMAPVFDHVLFAASTRGTSMERPSA